MLTGANDLLREAQSLVDWWQLAGVEWDFADRPNDWLADDAPPVAASGATKPTTKSEHAAQARKPVAPPVQLASAPLILPDTLEAFQAAWREGGLAADGGHGPHIGPSGKQGAKVMIITGAPERDDGPHVISGRTSPLVDNIARACGFDPQDIYRASLFPRVVLDSPSVLPHLANWAKIAHHHIGLVSPEMLVIAGEATARALLKHDPSQNPSDLQFLNHGDRIVKTVVTRKLSLMLHRIAPEKKLAWTQWQKLLVE